jgi:hypothetical protein
MKNQFISYSEKSVSFIHFIWNVAFNSNWYVKVLLVFALFWIFCQCQILGSIIILWSLFKLFMLQHFSWFQEIKMAHLIPSVQFNSKVITWYDWLYTDYANVFKCKLWGICFHLAHRSQTEWMLADYNLLLPSKTWCNFWK